MKTLRRVVWSIGIQAIIITAAAVTIGFLVAGVVTFAVIDLMRF
jgi:hypothetical protein